MRTIFFTLLIGLTILTALSTFGQRKELTISPVGFFYPKNQLIHYEQYVGSRQSLTLSLSHNSSGRGTTLFGPPRTDFFAVTRGAIGYRHYVSLFGDEVTLFGSIRAVVDYSTLQLRSDSRYPIPADSLRAAGFSVAPELLLGGKITIARRITLTGAVGAQHLFKLFPTTQITRNRAYWDGEYWTQDGQDWQYKRNVVVDYRRGRYPSILLTIGVVLGKLSQKATY